MSKKWTVKRNRSFKADGQEMLNYVRNCGSGRSRKVIMAGPKNEKVRIAPSPLLRLHPKFILTLRTLNRTLIAP